MISNKKDFLEFLAPTSPFPVGLEVEKAEGSYIYTKDGSKYLDFIAGIAVCNVGHRHPKVLEAIQNQLDKHLHVMVYGEFIQDSNIDLAKGLAAILPKKLSCFYLVNSGTEANEAAIKLARRATNKTEIISFNKSYHGNTLGSLSISGNEAKKFAFRPLIPDVKFIEFNDEADLEKITKKTAAVIVEPVQGDAGVRIGNIDYFKKLRNKCTEVGALLIFDEIQSGWGRTGSFFYFLQLGVVPDILTMAKGMGSGLPIGAVASSKELLSLFSHNPMLGHITTYGGNPVSSAASLAGLKVIQEDGFLSTIKIKTDLILSKLVHPKIKGIRAAGLMIAVDLDSPDLVDQMVHKCLEKKLIIYRFLSANSSFRLSPPLTISMDEIEIGCKIMIETLNEIS